MNANHSEQDVSTRLDEQTLAEHPVELNLEGEPGSPGSKRVLIADDDKVSRAILSDILTPWGYELRIARDGNEAWKELQDKNAPRLVILDWAISGVNGADLCRAIRSKLVDRYTYVLMVSAMSDPADIIRGLEAGADDYVAKPYNPLELRARLVAGRRILELQERLIGARESLRRLATTDALTGVPNRYAILETLERELGRSRRESRPLGVVMIDLDHFKRVNDLFGHLAGDKVLRRVAQKLKTLLRPYDSVGRYGDEEFLLALPGCDASNAVKLANRIRAATAAETVHHLGQPISISASFGVVSFNPRQPAPLQDLLNGADAALYRAKNNGRNRVEAGDPLKCDEPRTN